MKKQIPSTDLWLREAKADKDAAKCGMYLFHNGVVRESAKALVRQGDLTAAPVVGMEFSYDEKKVQEAVEEARKLPGIYYVRVWLNEGRLSVGEDIMLVLLGGDTRPHVVTGLETLVGRIKSSCVTEKEIH